MMEPVEAAAGIHVSRETLEKLQAYVKMLLAENGRQNLISKTSAAEVWDRHVIDSAQLIGLSPERSTWVDIGSGAGLPGIVVAILGREKLTMTLVEPRRLRAEFLRAVAAELDLTNVRVAQAKAEQVRGSFDVITARAVASLGDMFGITEHLVHRDTTYLLMKGRRAQSELEAARRDWHGQFELRPSRTADDAAIVVARGVRRKRGGRG